MGPMPSEQQPARRYHALDSLRGVCASMVVLLHLQTSGAISRSALVQHGSLFVDFFFVLSGFVIAASYGDRLAQGFPISKFMALRLGRIYPLHLTMLLLFVLFEGIFAIGLLGPADRQPFTGGNSLGMLLANLALIQTFVGPDRLSWNGPSWSIAVEVWTYLIFAFGYRFLPRLLMPLSAVLAALCCLYLYALTDRYLAVFHDGALARCLYGFALGTLAYRLHRRLGSAHDMARPLATLLEIAAVAIVCAMVAIAGPSPLSLLMPPLFFAVIILFARERGAVSALLTTRPFLLVGALSYSIYMVHVFLQYRTINALTLLERLSHGRLTLVAHGTDGNHVGGSPLFGDVMSVVMLGVTIAFAYVTHRLIEKPGQDWSRRRVLGDYPRATTVRAEAEAPTF